MGVRVVNQIFHANTFFTRLKGLMGTKELRLDSGLLLEPCDSVHTWYMKYAIDVIYINKENNVLHVEHSMKPNKWGKKIPGAVKVLEVNGGLAKAMGLAPGNEINLMPKGDDHNEEKCQ